MKENVPESVKHLLHAKLKNISSRTEPPVLAVVFSSSWELISESFNSRETDNDPTGHAEITAIREAAKRLGTWKLNTCTLFTSLQPCIMCSSVIREARIPKVVYCVESKSATFDFYDLLRDTRLPGAPAELIRLTMGSESVEESRRISNFFRSLRQ